jgi:hypothetical protein
VAESLVAEDTMPSDPEPTPVVHLTGTAMLAIVQAIPELEARTGRKATVVGGLAVLSRLGIAYRATSDLDTASRRAAGDKSQLDVLLNSPGTSRAGPAGAWISVPAGTVQVDIIEVTEAELRQLPEDETDRLAVLSHAWAIETASAVKIHATGADAVSADAVVRVAQPGPLIAMKLQSIMNRSASKERTDLLDIIRLTLDRAAGQPALEQLRNASSQLAVDAQLHAGMWFAEHKDRTLRRVRELPEGADIDADTIQLVGELLLTELKR